MLRTVDPVAATTLKSYEHQQLLRRARWYISIKGAVNAVIIFLFWLTFPPELRPGMIAIVLIDALLLVPYWFLLQRYPTLATCFSLCITSLAISGGDWVGGYQTGASGILYALLILAGHLILINPLRTRLVSGLIIATYVSTIALETGGVIPINFPFTFSNLSRVVSLNVIAMIGLTALTSTVTRLYRELLQRNKELFALNAISATASQSLNLNEVLQLALDKVLEVMELEGGGLYLLEANTGEMVLKAHRNLAEEFVGRVSRMEVGIEGFSDSPLRTGCVLVVDDPSQHPIVGKIVGDEEWRYPVVIAPLKVEDRVLGTMNLLGQAGSSFTSQDIALLNTIGAQIGMAIENARLYDLERDRYRMAESMRKIAEVVGSTLELNEVLQLVLEQLRKVLDYDTSSIMTLEGDRLQVIAVVGFTNPEEVLQIPYTADEAAISWEAIQKKQALVIADVTQDPRWTYEPQTAEVRAWIGAPLIADDKVIGLLTVDSYQVGKYNQDDAQLVMTFARQAALAIKNAQLFGKTKQRFEETIALYQTSLDIPERRRAEEMLRIKDHTVASSITAIAIAEFVGNLTYVNPAFLKMWGYDDESEVLGRPAADFWESPERARRVIDALRDGDSFAGELVAKRRDGSLFDVQLSSSIVADEAGKPICMMGSFVDITARKRAEEALRRAHDELERRVEERTAELKRVNEALQAEIAERKQTENMLRHSQEKTARSHRLLLALSQAAQAVQRARTPEEVYCTVGNEVTDLGYDIMAFTLTDDREHLALSYMSFESDLVRTAEKLTGLSAQGYRFPLVPGGLFQRIIAEGETTFVEMATEAIAEAVPEPVRPLAGWLAAMLRLGQVIYAPLLVGDQVYGLLAMVGTGLTEDDASAVTAFANQTAIAVENTRLYQMERKRATQLAVVNQVAQRVASILTLEQLLPEVVVAIQQGFNYHNVALSLLDEALGELEVRAIAGSFVDLVSPGYRQAVGVGMVGWVAETGQSLLVNDVSQEPRYILGFLEEPLTQSELCVPLKLTDKVIGVLDVQDTQLNAFDETDLLAMETLAGQIAVAIENARLFGETSRRFDEITALYQTSLDITTQLDMSGLLRSIVERAVTLLRADTGSIALFDPRRGELRWVASYGYAEKYVGTTFKPGEHIAGKVFQTGEHLILDDYRTWKDRAPAYGDDLPFVALLEVPLKWQKRIMGVLAINADAQKRTFGQDDIWLATLFANQAAIAIENAQLYEAANQQLRELKELATVSQRITSNLDLISVLEETVVQSLSTLEADRAAIFMLDRDTHRFTCACSHGLSPEHVDLVSRHYKELPGGAVLNSSEPIQVLDAHTDPATEIIREAIVREGYHTFAVLPLVGKGEVVGALVVYRDNIRTFRPGRLALGQSFANQAAVAIENARLHREIQQGIEELTLLNRVARTVTSSLNLEQVLTTVLEETARALGTEAGAVLLLDEKSGELVFEAVVGPRSEEIAGRRLSVGQGFAGWVAQENQRLLVPNARDDPRFLPDIEGAAGFVARSVLAVPLRLRGRVIGVIEAVDKIRGSFSQPDVRLLLSIAQWAAIAIENARLYQQTDEALQIRLEELSALYAITEMINRSSDLDQVLRLALDSATDLAGMESGGILLFDPAANEMFLRAHRGWSPEFIQTVREAKADEGLMPRMLESALVLDDLSKLSAKSRVASEKEGFRSMVSIPIKAKESALGVIGIQSRSPRTFSHETLELLAAIGSQVGVAVDRANLQTQELRAAILEERQEMARQMHDDIAQTLGYLGLQLDSVMDNSSLVQNAEVQAELEGLRKIVGKAYRGIRKSITRLQEDVPSHFDLGIALSDIIKAFEKQTRCNVESKVDRDLLLGLSASVALQANYIIREALANVVKHSDADSVCLTIRGLEDDMIEIIIQDDGSGFDFGGRKSGLRGFGLRFMRERAERVGGTLSIESEPGQGTRVAVRLPAGPGG